MILTSSVSPDDTQAMRDEVNKEIAKMNIYLASIKMGGLKRMDSTMLREYLHAKVRGHLDRSSTPDAEAQPTDDGSE